MRKIAVWGTGDDGRKLIENNYALGAFIEFFIDNDKNKEGSNFFGKQIINPTNVNWSNNPFIIISTRKFYNEIKSYLINQGLREGIDFIADVGIKRVIEFIKICNGVSKWVSNIDLVIKNNFEKIISELQISKKRPLEVLLAFIVDKDSNTIELSDGCNLKFSELYEFSIIFEEILIGEEYYFETDSKCPIIIDAGANIGLAIYYFKKLYPRAKIIAFEPMKELRDIIERNIAVNNWMDVQVLPFALSDKDEDKSFFVTESSLAGSLTQCNLDYNNTSDVKEIKVPCVTLGRYLTDGVDYLKLDIEGSETKVIHSIKDKLSLVQHMFIEYHEGRDIRDNSLGKILYWLDEAGFDYNVGKSQSFTKSTKHKPMGYVGRKMSELVWAKRSKQIER